MRRSRLCGLTHPHRDTIRTFRRDNTRLLVQCCGLLTCGRLWRWRVGWWCDQAGLMRPTMRSRSPKPLIQSTQRSGRWTRRWRTTDSHACLISLAPSRYYLRMSDPTPEHTPSGNLRSWLARFPADFQAPIAAGDITAPTLRKFCAGNPILPGRVVVVARHANILGWGYFELLARIAECWAHKCLADDSPTPCAEPIDELLAIPTHKEIVAALGAMQGVGRNTQWKYATGRNVDIATVRAFASPRDPADQARIWLAYLAATFRAFAETRAALESARASTTDPSTHPRLHALLSTARPLQWRLNLQVSQRAAHGAAWVTGPPIDPPATSGKEPQTSMAGHAAPAPPDQVNPDAKGQPLRVAPRFRLSGWRDLQIHPLCRAFPDAAPRDAALLELSLESKGYNPDCPIYLHEGMVLDGRLRLAICRHLGIAPIFARFEGDSPAEFLFERNLARRHTSPGQRSWAATCLLKLADKSSLSSQSETHLRHLSRELSEYEWRTAEFIYKHMKNLHLRERLVRDAPLLLTTARLLATLPEEEQDRIADAPMEKLREIAHQIYQAERARAEASLQAHHPGPGARETPCSPCNGLLALCPYAKEPQADPAQISALVTEWAGRWNTCDADWILFGWRNSADLPSILDLLRRGLSRYIYQHTITVADPHHSPPMLSSGLRLATQPILAFNRFDSDVGLDPPHDDFLPDSTDFSMASDLDCYMAGLTEFDRDATDRCANLSQPSPDYHTQVVTWLACLLACDKGRIVACWTPDADLAHAREHRPDCDFVGLPAKGRTGQSF